MDRFIALMIAIVCFTLVVELVKDSLKGGTDGEND